MIFFLRSWSDPLQLASEPLLSLTRDELSLPESAGSVERFPLRGTLTVTAALILIA